MNPFKTIVGVIWLAGILGRVTLRDLWRRYAR